MAAEVAVRVKKRFSTACRFAWSGASGVVSGAAAFETSIVKALHLAQVQWVQCRFQIERICKSHYRE